MRPPLAPEGHHRPAPPAHSWLAPRAPVPAKKTKKERKKEKRENAAVDATKDVASATYNTGAAVAGTAVDATKSAANTAYNTVAPKKTSRLPAGEGHLGPPVVGIAGAYGNSALAQATDLESDSAISAVFIPANERTSAQQAAVDAALNRSLEPMDVTTVETPTSTTTTYFSPTAEILSAPITEIESAPIPSYASTRAYDAPIVSSVLPKHGSVYIASGGENLKRIPYLVAGDAKGSIANLDATAPSPTNNNNNGSSTTSNRAPRLPHVRASFDRSARELASPPSDGMSARSIPTSSKRTERATRATTSTSGRFPAVETLVVR
ncbi:hypothetical protein HKX48_002246 [Thoreauomyces humboldtii]|nr:hypothetical protein HKX48_002246 [Thoreauomyces humboldtii]